MSSQSLHVHTTFCDGRNTPEEMVRAAVAQGCGSLGFSGHSPLSFDDTWTIAAEDLPRYRAQVEELRQRYAGQIQLYLGLEQDFCSEPAGSGWDYLIGSVHCIPKDGVFLSVDECPERLNRETETHYGGDFLAYARDYYRLVAQVAQRTACQIVGHFDLITKFNEGSALFSEDDPRYRTAALEALEALLEQDVIFEINTGAISRGYRTAPYPAPFLLRHIAQRHGRVTLTSDSHACDTILYGYQEAGELARACGFTTFWQLTPGGFEEIPLPQP